MSYYLLFTIIIIIIIIIICLFMTFTTTEKQPVVGVAQQSDAPLSAPFYPPNHDMAQKTYHNTRNYMPYSLRQVSVWVVLRPTGL